MPVRVRLGEFQVHPCHQGRRRPVGNGGAMGLDGVEQLSDGVGVRGHLQEVSGPVLEQVADHASGRLDPGRVVGELLQQPGVNGQGFPVAAFGHQRVGLADRGVPAFVERLGPLAFAQRVPELAGPLCVGQELLHPQQGDSGFVPAVLLQHPHGGGVGVLGERILHAPQRLLRPVPQLGGRVFGLGSTQEPQGLPVPTGIHRRGGLLQALRRQGSLRLGRAGLRQRPGRGGGPEHQERQRSRNDDDGAEAPREGGNGADEAGLLPAPHFARRRLVEEGAGIGALHERRAADQVLLGEFQVAQQRVGVVALLPVLGQHLLDHGVQEVGHELGGLAGRHLLLLDVRRQVALAGFRMEGGAADDQLVGHHAQAEDVRPPVHGQHPDLLWREVLGRARDARGYLLAHDVGFAHVLGDAQVGQLDVDGAVGIAVQQYVSRLDVSMDYALVVYGHQGAGGLAEDVDLVDQLEVFLPTHAAQQAFFDQLHGVVEAVPLLAGAQEPDHVGMLDVYQHADLAVAQLAGHLRLALLPGLENLDGDDAAVPTVAGAIHAAYGPLAQVFKQRILGERRGFHVCHSGHLPRRFGRLRPIFRYWAMLADGSTSGTIWPSALLISDVRPGPCPAVLQQLCTTMPMLMAPLL